MANAVVQTKRYELDEMARRGPGDRGGTPVGGICTPVVVGSISLCCVSILVNLLRTPLSTIDRLLPAEDKARIGSVFLGVLPWLVALLVAALLVLMTDTNVPHGYWWLQLIAVGLLLATILSLARMVRVLRRLLSVSAE